MTRASMLDVLTETYITAARAAGLGETEIRFKLALKNAVVPTLTVLGLVFAFSITGAVLVEIIFKTQRSACHLHRMARVGSS